MLGPRFAINERRSNTAPRLRDLGFPVRGWSKGRGGASARPQAHTQAALGPTRNVPTADSRGLTSDSCSWPQTTYLRRISSSAFTRRVCHRRCCSQTSEAPVPFVSV